MTTKGKLNDQSVKERRLRPVYDFLDVGNHKRVVQEADRLLRKQPDFQCAKALKALALLRMGHVGECRTIVDGLVAEVPTDDSTIQALTICFRELGEPGMVCVVLENASKIEKTEDLLSSCFMANVRVSDFHKQYQIALNLYKLNPKPPYYAWAVMSLFAKAEFDSDEAARRVTLPLATKMMEKYIDDYNVFSEHEHALYFLLLSKLGNYSQILSRIEQFSLNRTSTQTGFCYRMKSEALRNTDLAKFKIYLQDLIRQNDDEWNYFDDYIRTFGSSHTIDTLEFFDSLCPSADRKRSRCVLLAPLHLYKHIHLDTALRDKLEEFDIAPYLKSYLAQYGDAPSLFIDLEPFLESLTSKVSRQSVAQIIQTELESKRQNMSLPAHVQTELNYSYIERYIRSLEPTEFANFIKNEAYGNVADLVGKYLKVREDQLTLGMQWPLKEGPHDFLVNLASLILTDRFWESSSRRTSVTDKTTVSAPPTSDTISRCRRKSSSDKELLPNDPDSSLVPTDHVLQSTENIITNGMSFLQMESQKPFLPNERDVDPLLALTLLNYCLDKTPGNPQTRLILAKTYVRCGAVSVGSHLLIELDIKHVMLTTVAYLNTWKLLSFGNHEEGLHQLSTLEGFYTGFEKEGIEHVLSAYKYGSWEKILEFLHFRKDLLNSLQRELSKVEKGLLEYFMEGPSELPLTKSLKFYATKRHDVDLSLTYLEKIDLVTDTQDLDLIDLFKARPKLHEWKKAAFESDKAKLRVRWITFAIMNTFVQLSEEPSAQIEKLTKIEVFLALLEVELTKDRSIFSTLDDVGIDGAWRPRFAAYIQDGCLGFLFDLFQISSKIITEASGNHIVSLTDKLIAFVHYYLQQSKFSLCEEQICLLDVEDTLESLTDLLETLSFTCIIVELLSLFLKSSKSKKKKSKVQTDDPENMNQSVFSKLIHAVMWAFSEVDVFLRTFTTVMSQKYPSTWESMESFWRTRVSPQVFEDILPYSLPVVVAKLRSSYVNSTTTWSYLVHAKTSYLERTLSGFKN